MLQKAASRPWGSLPGSLSNMNIVPLHTLLVFSVGMFRLQTNARFKKKPRQGRRGE